MIHLPASVSGHFHIVKRHGGRVTEERHFDNLVMSWAFSNLVERLRGDSAWQVARYLFLGSGDSEPSYSDPGLENRRAGPGKVASEVSYSNVSNPPLGIRTNDVRLRFDFAVGEATGMWTEFGAADDPDYTTPYNRALIRDEAGVAVPLIVMSDESLTVYMTLRLSEGLRFAKTGEMQLAGQRIGYTLTPTSSRYWFDDGYNAWSGGYANRSIQMLDAEGNSLTYLSKDTRMPWPYPPGEPSTTLTPEEEVTHHFDERRTEVRFALTHSEHDVEIHGFVFGPNTSVSDRIYHLAFHEPFIKPALYSMNFTVSITFTRGEDD